MELESTITKDNLIILMTLFYKRVILDEELSHFFTHELGEDIEHQEWIEHIELLADFWLVKFLGEDTGEYRGNFVGMHVEIPYIAKNDFKQWMKLFVLSAEEIYVESLAKEFKRKGKMFSAQFIHELGL